MNKKLIIILSLIVIGVILNITLIALRPKEKEEVAPTISPELQMVLEKKEKECLEKFDFNQVIQEGVIYYNQESMENLIQYLECQAAIKQNPFQCNLLKNVSPDIAKDCQRLFYLFPNFLGRIIKNKKCGAEEIEACKKAIGNSGDPGQEAWCQKFCLVILERDFYRCSEWGDEDFKVWCLAMLSQDEKYCNFYNSQEKRKYCQSQARYYKALIDNEESKCNQIEHPHIKMYCHLFFSETPTSFCQEKLEKFKAKYCHRKVWGRD